MQTKYVIFDLDDTLMYEIDYLKSAYKEIAEFLDKENQQSLYEKMINWYQSNENVFNLLIQCFPDKTIDQLLYMYRNHFPEIQLNEGALEVFDFCKTKGYKLGLITDGRSVTQRNKLKSLGIENLFDKIIVSEEIGSTKPDVRNFEIFMNEPFREYFYIADNPKKDFVTPNKFGWTSVCLLDKGINIHNQDFEGESDLLPKIKIKSLFELKTLL